MTESTQPDTTGTTATAPGTAEKPGTKKDGTPKKPRAKKEGAAKGGKRPPTPSRLIPKSAFADVESVAKSTGVSKFYLRGKIIDAYGTAIANAIANVSINPAHLAAEVLRAKLATLGPVDDGSGTGDGTGSGGIGTGGPANLPLD